MNIPSEEIQLLKGLALNDDQAIKTIYERNYGMVNSLIINNNGSSDDARDIFQEAMIILYEKAKDPAFTLTCLIKTYLYSVCKRLWLKRLKQRQQYVPDIGEVVETLPVEDDLESHQQLQNEFQLMDKAMAGLGEPCKSLLEAFYLQKKNMNLIAAEFGYTNADNAKNQKYKCLSRLKKIFFSEYNTVK